MRIVKWVAAASLAVGLVLPAYGQMDPATAQKKLLSRRSAEADAYRKLAETVRGLQITSDTYVQDFVTESDQIRGAMDTFIRGIRLGQPRWFADLSCEVPAEVTVAKVIETLKEIHERYYKGHKVKANDFQEITRHVEKKVLQVVGMGAPRPDLPPDLPQGVVEQLGGPPEPPQPPFPALWLQLGPQARMMAIRGAKMDAMRKLAERIKGVHITSDTQVRDFVTESDRISTQVQAMLSGFREVSTYLHADEPIAEVTLEVPVESVISCIKELHNQTIKGHHVKGSDITEVTNTIKTQTFQATGMGIPRPDMLQRFNTMCQNPVDQVPPWAVGPIRATGSTVIPPDKAGSPQGKLLAARGAEVDAKRRLAEQIKGLQISSQTTVRDFVTERDEINAQVNAVLLGATVEKTTFDGDTASVTVSIPGMAVWDVVHDGLRLAQNVPPGAMPMRGGPGPAGMPPRPPTRSGAAMPPGGPGMAPAPSGEEGVTTPPPAAPAPRTVRPAPAPGAPLPPPPPPPPPAEEGMGE